ncbi:uncharacterized protein LOC136073639 [Hydra vulgaris]|uniref:uncharacterized protein LOC136073639 n=1 Tax=Hydra vulgaris TaxID=6087 RepID=UPI0032EA572C
METSRKFRSKRHKSRKFYGNQHSKNFTENSKVTNKDNIATTVSYTKLNGSMVKVVNNCCSKNITGNRIVDMELLAETFRILLCPECSHNSVKLNQKQKLGIAFELELKCTMCGWFKLFWTSKKRSKTKSFDINSRMFYSIRRIGKGYQSLKLFLTLLNHPPPMTEKSYNNIASNYQVVIKKVAKNIMHQAVKEIRTLKKLDPIVRQQQSILPHLDSQADILCDAGVSVDGTWQRRGFSSNNGIVAAISIDTGRVLDIEVMSKYCQACINARIWKHSNVEKYASFIADHTCTNNHHGSAPSMELVGTEKIFNRSIELNKMRYTEFYGDGDSKSFLSIENVYDGTKVVKQECIGHVQKRVGTRLRELKKREKGLRGKGKLTDAVIDKLQNYYGIAIRSNIGNLKGMQIAVMAALFHVASSKEHSYHTFCPKEPGTWCQYHLDKLNNTQNYKPGPGLPMSVIKFVKPTFIALQDENLLSKCLHGKTQNQNESFNATIWNRVPKDTFVKLVQLEIAAYDAVAHFNIGNLATLKIYDKMQMERGSYTELGCKDKNRSRLKNASRKNGEKYRMRRKFLRGVKKSKGSENKNNEGLSYGAGSF